MRNWGRVKLDPNKNKFGIGYYAIGTSNFGIGLSIKSFPNGYYWKISETDSNGFNANVWLTTLSQVCQMQIGESPLYSNLGIPSLVSEQTGISPDYYAILTQQYFSGFFKKLLISRNIDQDGNPNYTFDVIPEIGAIIDEDLPL